ncbi:MAG: PilZ domain-containing protein [Candidatus Aminicenantaceae bacterium]
MADKIPDTQEERRRYPRLEVPIMYRSSRKEGPALPTQNFSLGGVRIYSNAYLKEGKQIEIELCLPQEESIVATVRVVWTKVLPPGSDAVFDVALEFLDLPDGAMDKIKEILNKNSVEE